MKFIIMITFFGVLLFNNQIFSNDGTFRSMGSSIYPVKETRISMDKEILKFKCREGKANVSVYFEFNNPEKNNILTKVGFVFPFFSMDYDGSSNPYELISNFQVKFENQILPAELKWSKKENGKLKDISSLNLDQVESGYYIYLFDVNFRPGLNKIYHNFDFKASNYVYINEIYSYVLKTGSKWAGGKISDFQLEIDMGDNTYFYVEDNFGKQTEWKIDGFGKISEKLYNNKSEEIYNYRMVRIVNGKLMLNIKNFSPKKDLSFGLINNKWFVNYLMDSKYFSEDFLAALNFLKWDEDISELKLTSEDLQLMKNLIYAQYGYDFKKPAIKKFFNRFEWYIPNENLKLEDIKLSQFHKNCIQKINKLENSLK